MRIAETGPASAGSLFLLALHADIPVNPFDCYLFHKSNLVRPWRWLLLRAGVIIAAWLTIPTSGAGLRDDRN
jgi:hypothetical protein